jgi:hypothetical protein
MLIFLNGRERYGREDARDDYGDDADGGHDERIMRLRDRELLFSLHRAHLDGEYEYGKPMQEVDEDLRRELEEENNRRWQQFNEEQEDNGEEYSEAICEENNRRWQQFNEEQEDNGEEYSEATSEESSDMDLESDEEM